MLFICLTAHQQRPQAIGAAMHVNMVNLLLVMVIDKGLDRSNRRINSETTSQGWQCTCQPSSQPPWAQQTTSLRGRQPIFQRLQMIGFGCAVGLGKGDEFNVLAPLRHREDSLVNVDSTCLTCMVRAEFLLKMERQACCHQPRSFRHPAASGPWPAPSGIPSACFGGCAVLPTETGTRRFIVVFICWAIEHRATRPTEDIARRLCPSFFWGIVCVASGFTPDPLWPPARVCCFDGKSGIDKTPELRRCSAQAIQSSGPDAHSLRTRLCAFAGRFWR